MYCSNCQQQRYLAVAGHRREEEHDADALPRPPRGDEGGRPRQRQDWNALEIAGVVGLLALATVAVAVVLAAAVATAGAGGGLVGAGARLLVNSFSGSGGSRS